MGYLTAGRVAPVPRGEWDPLYDYHKLDMVSWGNSTYIARKSSRGAEPIEHTDEYWFLCLSPYLTDMTGATDSKDGSHGLVPQPLIDDRDKFLRGNGTWTEIDLSEFNGADADFDGKKGMVPKPLAGDQDKFLRGDGTWSRINLTGATGTLPITNGGTGATSVAAARNALGLGNTAGALPIANGGTGATSVAAARNALGVPPLNHASSSTDYGLGTNTNYGHVKLSDDYYYSADVNNVKADKGWGASLYALKMAFKLTEKKSYNQIDYITGSSKEYTLNPNGYPYLVICSVNVVGQTTRTCFEMIIVPARDTNSYVIDWDDRYPSDSYGNNYEGVGKYIVPEWNNVPHAGHTANTNTLIVYNTFGRTRVCILSFNSSN